MIRLGVLGHPINHSRSPELHQQFAHQCNRSIDYQKVDVAPGTFEEVIAGLIGAGWRGCNVTVPYKFEAFEVCTERSETAESTGVVNTLVFGSDDNIIGHNTDGPGLLKDIRQHLGWQLTDSRILVLGAGGATQGVLGSLLAAQPRAIHLWNRTHERAHALGERHVDPRLEARASKALEAEYDVIIHASAAGLMGERVEVPSHVVGPKTLAYDLSYNSQGTPFLQWVSSMGAAATADGLGMLIEQAALAFEIWFDQLPSTEMLRRSEGLVTKAG